METRPALSGATSVPTAEAKSAPVKADAALGGPRLQSPRDGAADEVVVGDLVLSDEGELYRSWKSGFGPMAPSLGWPWRGILLAR